MQLNAAEIAQWARSRDGEYRYISLRNCALAQYLESTGTPAEYVTGDSVFRYEDGVTMIPPAIADALLYHPHTFADLATRLEAI